MQSFFHKTMYNIVLSDNLSKEFFNINLNENVLYDNNVIYNLCEKTFLMKNISCVFLSIFSQYHKSVLENVDMRARTLNVM